MPFSMQNTSIGRPIRGRSAAVRGSSAACMRPLEPSRVCRVTAAYKARSLKSFEEAKKSYGDVVSADPVLDQHLKALYGDLLRLNLLRLLEPYSRVEVAYLAQQLELSVDIVEAKLNELVLDGVLSGVIDEAGNFEVFPAEDASTAYDDALATLGNLDKVVSALFQRSAKLMA